MGEHYLQVQHQWFRRFYLKYQWFIKFQDKIFIFNPFWQIMEIKSKNWDLVQQVSWNWNPIKFIFGNVTERYFWKHNPDENWGHNDLRTVYFTYRDFHSRSAIFTWPSIFTVMEFLKQSEANIKTSQKYYSKKFSNFYFLAPINF